MSEGISSIGTCMAFASAKPATEDAAGYAALTWVTSGEATNVGDVGPDNQVITFDTVCDGKVNKRMGATNYGQQNLVLAYDKDNNAQAILETKVDDKTSVSVRETLPGTAGTLYYMAYVASLKTQSGSSSDFLRASLNLEIDSKIIKV